VTKSFHLIFTLMEDSIIAAPFFCKIYAVNICLVIIPENFLPFVANPSKSAHFILFPLTSCPIFAAKNQGIQSGFVLLYSNAMKTSRINFFYVTEIAKLYLKCFEFESQMVSRLYTAKVGKESKPAFDRKGSRKLLSFKQSEEKMERQG
jgi:hypothetical protein